MPSWWELSSQFNRLYSRVGRPSILPEHLSRALLLQILYSVRSERLLLEQLDYSLLFRWFVGLKADDRIWDATVFTKNRQRLLDGDIARAFFDRVVAHAREGGLLSDEHFTVDGTLIEAWASLKSFKSKGSPPAPPLPDRTQENKHHDEGIENWDRPGIDCFCVRSSPCEHRSQHSVRAWEFAGVGAAPLGRSHIQNRRPSGKC
jgi:transposase